MQASKSRLLHETLRRYLRRQAWDHIDKLLSKTRDEELAQVMESMGVEHQLALWRRLEDGSRKASIIVNMDAPFGQLALGPMNPPEAAAILKEMAADDMADIVAELDPEQQAAILDILDAGDEVESLMQYGEETAGGIMLPDYVALHADTTCEEAIQTLRDAGDVEMAYYIYAVNEHGHLVGVVSLRRLVSAPPHARVRTIMESDVLSVTPDTDQEAVAQIVARYGFLAVPVTDESNKLLGIVTVDDVIDVLREEATEDILKMVGAGQSMAEHKGVVGNILARFPWLLASCAGGLLSALALTVFTDTLQAHHYLELYLPLVLGMGGNVGTQSATVTVRSLALGHLELGRTWATIRKEFLIGVALGIVYGLIVGGIATIFGSTPLYGLAIGLAIIAGVTVAATIGSSIPIVLDRLSIDPAIATAPIVTTCVDILGIFTYFGIATLLLPAVLGSG